jgi:hypothetical protein
MATIGDRRVLEPGAVREIEAVILDPHALVQGGQIQTRGQGRRLGGRHLGGEQDRGQQGTDDGFHGFRL